MVIKGLKGIPAAETSISFIDGEKGTLIYRGYEASKLALSYSFEEIAYFLWNEKFPDKTQLFLFKKDLAAARELPEHLKRILDLLPHDMGIMEVLRTCVSAMGTTEYGWIPTIGEAMRLTAIVPVIIAYWYRKVNGWSPIAPNPKLGHSSNYLYMLRGDLASEAQE
jgi:citrate synthase